MSILTIRVPDDLEADLQKISREQNKPVGELVREWLRRCVAREQSRALPRETTGNPDPLDVTLGAAHQFQESEEGDKSDDFAGVVGVDLDFDLPGGTELDNSYKAQIVATDFDKTSHHFESTLSVDIWGPLDLDLTFMLDRIEKPDREDDGTRPDENDISIMAGMSIEF